jgi:ribonuclease HI
VVVHFDGACQPPHGGIATWGYTIEGAGMDHMGLGEVEPCDSPLSTNNVGEYFGAIRALEYLVSKGYRGPVQVIGDSELVVRQVQGTYRAKQAHLRPLLQRVKELESQFERVDFRSVPREQNERANDLTQRALQEARRRRERGTGEPAPT